MTNVAIIVAFWASIGGITAQVWVLCFKEQEPFERVIDLVGICINAVIIVGLWPLVLGGGE